MKIICGDANPKGNVYLTAKGGCRKELDIKDAYRCTGCGVWFHRDCIFKHFEQEEGHSVAHNALAEIKKIVLEKSEVNCGIDILEPIFDLCKKGLDRTLQRPKKLIYTIKELVLLNLLAMR